MVAALTNAAANGFSKNVCHKHPFMRRWTYLCIIASKKKQILDQLAHYACR